MLVVSAAHMVGMTAGGGQVGGGQVGAGGVVLVLRVGVLVVVLVWSSSSL